MRSVVVIGDALIDELRDETGVQEFVGGAALNVAVGLARLGVPTTLIAMVGDDEAGDRIREFVADKRVTLLASPSALGSSRAVSVRVAGEPTYAFNAAAQARRIEWGAAERAAVDAADRVVVSCFPFDDVEQTAALVDQIAKAPAKWVIDPNPREGMLHDRDRFCVGFEAAAQGIGVVKIGDDDTALLYRQPLDEVAARVREWGVDAVLATRGSEGATLLTDAGSVSRPVTVLAGPVVDTMGAGDASLAALVASMVRDDPTSADEWADALGRSMAVAAATCRFQGALLRTPESLDDSDIDRLAT